MTRRIQRFTPLALAAALAAGCGSDDDESCDVAQQTGCGSGLVCELAEGGSSVCAQPLFISGNVFDLGTAAPVESARVVALDANRSPISTVAITGATGEFRIQVANPRTRTGAPVPRDVFLRADAQGYATFPSGIRQALPVNTAGAVRVDDALVVADPQTTDLGLLETPAGDTGVISGVAEVPANQLGVLVVAEPVTGGASHSALADRNGDYAMFNVEPGDYAVRAYARGAVHEPADARVSAGAVTDVDLAVVPGSTGATVSGQVSLVNRGAGTGTSVVLVIESTFDPLLLRGETPPGLRAPGPGSVPNLTGAWEIPGVPPGRYLALAAFENDFLVRDPDVCQGGTEIVPVELAGAQPVTLDRAFKITGSLDVISPGADGPELLTTATPTFSWKDDSSETGYELTVIDAFGHTVWTHLEPAHSGDDPAVTGPALEPGYYQFRVRSVKGDCVPPGSATPVTQYISQTEDLKGVFVVPLVQ